jgi:hypothetical protein
MCSLRCEGDVRAAEALAASLDRTGNLVTSIVPRGYERYVRILNPIETTDRSTIRWSEIVERNGLDLNPWMQWDELRAHPGVVLPVGNAEPAMANPHASLARALIRELRAGGDLHYFASWTGYAEETSHAAINFSPPGREMALYSGALVDEEGSAVVPVTDTGRVPLYWWPKNLQWCVGQDVYARSLIVGCDLPTAGRILAASDLDSHLIRETHAVPSEDW